MKSLNGWMSHVGFLAAVLLGTHLAHAGGKDGTRGGADGVSCNGGIFELFLGHGDSVPADTYATYTLLMGEDTPRATDLQGNRIPLQLLDFADTATILQSILSYVESFNPKLAADLRESIYVDLTFTPVEKIKKVDTGFKVGLFDKFFGCSRKQLAVQNLANGDVKLSQKEYGQKLTHLSQALVKLHEASIHLNHLSDPTADLKTLETRARNWVSAIFNSPGFNSFVIADILSGENRPSTDVSNILLPWVRTIFWDFSDARYSAEDLYQALAAGFDPNFVLPGKMPILLYSIGRQDPYGDEMAYPDALISGVNRSKAFGAGPNPGAALNSTDIYGRTLLFIAMYGDEMNQDQHRSEYPLLAHFLSRYEDELDVNAAICQRTSQNIPEGSPAYTLLDWANAWKDVPLKKFLIAHGAKTGNEAGLTCPAISAITGAEVGAANKAFKASGFMPPEIW